jgi:HEAT repeat protein
MVALVSSMSNDLYSGANKTFPVRGEDATMERFRSARKKSIAAVVLLLVVAFAGVIWLQRGQLLAWYYAYRLARADEPNRSAWVDRTAALGEKAVPSLVSCLASKEDRVCSNARAALIRLTERWAAEDPRRALLTERLASSFVKSSISGQESALEIGTSLFGQIGSKPPPEQLVLAITHLLVEAAAVPNHDVRRQAMTLIKGLLDEAASRETAGTFREFVRACLRDQDPEIRIAAIQLIGHGDMNLLDQVVALLNDPVAQVRQAGLFAVGSAAGVIATDDLLHWLHDPDAQVRRTCEAALRGRGLRDEHIHLGKLMTAADAQTRLQVLDCLRRTSELEPGVWLRRLSHDPVSAVRAAAVRAAAEQKVVDLTDRLEQIAQNDPSPTVRQLARYYLNCRNSNGLGG